MNVEYITQKLREQFPDAQIVVNDEHNPTEIICEVEPTSRHAEYSVAIVVIDESKKHVHHKTREMYEVLKGELVVVKDEKEYILTKGDTLTINPGEVHYAKGNETWFKATSHPGWTVEDHIEIV